MSYIEEFFNLEGKVAAVIGAGGHLCGEMARTLARAGVNVAVIDRRIDDANKTADAITKTGGTAEAFELEVTDRQNHINVLEDLLGSFGDLDILINGAGINAPTPFFDISIEEWHSIIDVHTTGTFLGCQVFGRYMVDHKKGSIINMSSASAGPPLSKAFSYSVAKAGIKNLTQNLAREWAPYNVRVNALRPGFFPTEWSKKHFIDKERNDAILGHTPMNRYGKPEELSGAVLWLCSDSASFVTGAEINVDGGYSAMTI